MVDPRFFKCAGPFSLGEIADVTGAELSDPSKSDVKISDVAPLDQAAAGQLSFFDNVKYKDQFSVTEAEACFVSSEMAKAAPEHVVLLVSHNPYKSYALAAQRFYPEEERSSFISEQSSIDDNAEIGDGCHIGAFVFIGKDAEIGRHCVIESGATIGDNVKIGDYTRIGTNASLSHCMVGDYTRIYPGARIGQDGFGFAPDPSGFVKVPQLGRVLIGDHVEVGANTCVDRGAGPDTVIGSGTWIDNHVQIAHNVKIGKGCIIVAHAGISGSTVLEDYVVVGGQVGIAGHLRIGSGVQLGAQTGVMRDILKPGAYIGTPALPAKQFMRQVATLKRLIQNKKDV